MSEESSKMWDTFAEKYEEKLEYYTTEGFRGLSSLMKLDKAKRVLEVACGTGNGIPLIKEKVDEGTEIIACDFSRELIRRANLKNLGVQFLIADNLALPFENEGFDRYVANLSLHVVPDADKMLAEAFRVLKSGGLAGFTVWGNRSETNLFEIMNNAVDKAGYHDEDRSHFYLNDEVELRNRIRAAGFSSVLTHYSAVGLRLRKGEDLSLMFHDLPGMLGLKGYSERIYNDCLLIAKEEAERLLSQGKCLTFDLLTAIAVK